MTPIPDRYDYIAVGADAPEPDDCPVCGDYFCRPSCRLPVPVDELEPVAREDR